MTSHIIYHNFRKGAAVKESRFSKLVTRINTLLNDTCVFLCGICVGFGALALLMVVLSM